MEIEAVRQHVRRHQVVVLIGLGTRLAHAPDCSLVIGDQVCDHLGGGGMVDGGAGRRELIGLAELCRGKCPGVH